MLDGRGVAVADLDGDGRQDIVVANNDGPPTIYGNRYPQAGAALRLLLVGSPASGPDAIGARARLTVRRANGDRATLTRWVEAGSGYAAQSEFPLHFGLGAATALETLEILWPSGREETLEGADLQTFVPGGSPPLELHEGSALR